MTLPVAGNPISFSQVDVELGFAANAQISMNDTAVRTLFAAASGAIGMSNGYGKSNTSVPGAPTIGTATATSCSAISVSFTAPTCTGHLSITGYQVVCTSSGSHTATGSSSPISVTSLCPSTSYIFKVRAQNSLGYGAYSGTASATTNAVIGSRSYTTPGCYSWVAPTGVTKVSVVAIGGGAGEYGGASGGGLGYVNNYTVIPGNSYSVKVGRGGGTGPPPPCALGVSSFFVSTSVVKGGGGGICFIGGAFTGCGGGNGGFGGAGGGGAGGYSGNGGFGASGSIAGQSGAGGGGGGGGSICICYLCNSMSNGAGGGGVGINGQGGDGSGGSKRLWHVGCPYPYTIPGGGGGSGGSSGGTATFTGSTFTPGAGGAYGGGGGGYSGPCCNPTLPYGAGAGGAVRIVWPGNTRRFPSTCVGSP